MKSQLLALSLCGVLLTGCQSYRYRIVQPSSPAPAVADQPVTLRYDPLEYRLNRDRDRLAILITNPTDDRITLLGNRSFAVDPEGASHPLRDQVIAPRSYTRILVPPIPFTYAYPDYWWGYGPWWGPGWYDPFWGPYYGPAYWAAPTVSYRSIITNYDWKWKTGPARLRLTYDHGGKSFEHNFEFVREPDKK